VLVVWGAIWRKGGSLRGFYIFNPKKKKNEWMNLMGPGKARFEVWVLD